jgi:hypothetical protein
MRKAEYVLCYVVNLSATHPDPRCRLWGVSSSFNAQSLGLHRHLCGALLRGPSFHMAGTLHSLSNLVATRPEQSIFRTCMQVVSLRLSILDGTEGSQHGPLRTLMQRLLVPGQGWGCRCHRGRSDQWSAAAYLIILDTSWEFRP